MKAEVIRVGKRGTLVIPAELRQQFGLEEGSFVLAEDRGDGILLKTVVAVPVEHYSLSRRAEFLLSNATNPEEYEHVRAEVEKMGIDPDAIAHYKPKKNQHKKDQK